MLRRFTATLLPRGAAAAAEAARAPAATARSWMHTTAPAAGSEPQDMAPVDPDAPKYDPVHGGSAGNITEDDLIKTTGLERVELEAALKGENLFSQDWVNAPFGTLDDPVMVPSAYSERIIGVADPMDDSNVRWMVIREGEKKELFGQWFQLQRIAE